MQHAGQLLQVRAQALALRGEALQVAAGAKHAAGPRQQYRAHGAVLARADRRVHQLASHRAVERVAGIGPVERDARDMVAQLVADRRVIHDRLPPL